MRRIYTSGAHSRAAIRRLGPAVPVPPVRPDDDAPYDAWRTVRLQNGRIVHERLRGAPGYIAHCRMQVQLALRASSRLRRKGQPDAARAAINDARGWRDRELQARARNAASDRLWHGHRARLVSDPSTWQQPWSPLTVNLGHGMTVDVLLYRRERDL